MSGLPLSRRDWLQATGHWALGAGLAAGTGLAPIAAPADEKFPVIDTHTHFYDPTRKEGVPWPGKGDEVLYRPVLPPEFQKLTQPLGVTGTVVVEASPWLEDNQWLLDLAARHPVLLAVVGNLDPLHDDFPQHVQRFSRQPKFRGFRISQQKLKELLAEQRGLERLKLLIDLDWALDINGGPDLLADAARLAEALPKLKIVVNHLANVRIEGGPPPMAWRDNLKRCGNSPRVWCKVSALVEGAHRPDNTAPENLDHYRPVLDAAWDAFGADRLMFGSNWPVSARYGSYELVFRLVRDYFAAKPEGTSAKFFGRNAVAAYTIP